MSAQGDTTLTKLFVGGLAWETTKEGVHGYFEQFGEIAEAAVIADRSTGRSKGYGFVSSSCYYTQISSNSHLVLLFSTTVIDRS